MSNQANERNTKTQYNQRLTAVSGLIYIALLAGALANFFSRMLPLMPEVGSSPLNYLAFYSEHGGLIRFSNYLFALPVPVFLLFISGLYTTLRRAEPEGVFSMAALGAGLTMMSPWLRNLVVETSAVEIAAAGGDPAVIAAFDSFGPMTYSLGGLPRALLLIATSIIILRSGLAPRWIGWMGYVAALFALLGSVTFASAAAFPLTMIGLLISGIWLVSLNVSLLRAPQREQDPLVAGAPA